MGVHAAQHSRAPARGTAALLAPCTPLLHLRSPRRTPWPRSGGEGRQAGCDGGHGAPARGGALAAAQTAGGEGEGRGCAGGVPWVRAVAVGHTCTPRARLAFTTPLARPHPQRRHSRSATTRAPQPFCRPPQRTCTARRRGAARPRSPTRWAGASSSLTEAAPPAFASSSQPPAPLRVPWLAGSTHQPTHPPTHLPARVCWVCVNCASPQPGRRL